MAAINTIALAEKFSSELDKVLIHDSKTGIFEENDFGVSFLDAKTVRIPSIDMVGLGEYKEGESDSFPRGAVNVTNEIYQIKQDRARTFSIDAVVAGDTGIASIAGKTLAEFARTKVIPEKDAYVLSTLYNIALEKGNIVTGDFASAPYRAIMGARAIINNTGFDGEKLCYLTSDMLNEIILSEEISKVIQVTQFKQGEVNIEVKKLNDITFIETPADRLKTMYEYDEGNATDQGGFSPKEGAEDITFIMCPKNAASVIKKHEAIRIFSPDKNLGSDAWKIDYRLHYDCLVKKSMTGTIVAYMNNGVSTADLLDEGAIAAYSGEEETSTESIDYESMTVAELKAYAEEKGIDLGDATLKADIISVIASAESDSGEELE